MNRDILFLAHRLPYPPNKGDRIRSWHMLKALSEMGRVHVIAMADPADVQQGPSAELARQCASICLIPHKGWRMSAMWAGLRAGHPISFAYFESALFRQAVNVVMAQEPIGLVYGFSAQMGRYLPPISANVRVVMDFVDCDAGKFEDLARFAPAPLAWVYQREARCLDELTRHVAARADLSLFISQPEADEFIARTPGASGIQIVPNGVDLAYFQPVQDRTLAGAGPVILFAGQMDYAPNVDAVQQFARHVFPRIRQKYPDAIFAIVGRAPILAVHHLALLPGVRVFGEVRDVRPWLALAHCVVAPFRVARGVPNKILEAMAMARPVVATARAVAGLDVRAGKDLLVAETAEGQAAAVLEVLDNPAHAAALGKQGRVRVASRYHWARALSTLPDLLSTPVRAKG